MKLKSGAPFRGRAALEAQRATPLPRLLAGFTAASKVILLGRDHLPERRARGLARERRLWAHDRQGHRLRLCEARDGRRRQLRPVRRLLARGRRRGFPRSRSWSRPTIRRGRACGHSRSWPLGPVRASDALKMLRGTCRLALNYENETCGLCCKPCHRLSGWGVRGEGSGPFGIRGRHFEGEIVLWAGVPALLRRPRRG